MKYTFNEKDLFDLFISPLNPDFQTPSLMDGYVYATDGLRLIKIKADTLNGDYEPNGRLNEMMSKYRWPDNNCNCHITKEHIRQALASAPQKEELINVDCPECIGTGVIRCEYIDKAGKRHEVEAECPVCNGEGFESKNTRRIKYQKDNSMSFCNDYSLKFQTARQRPSNPFDAMENMGVYEAHIIAQAKDEIVLRIDENITVRLPCLLI